MTASDLLRERPAVRRVARRLGGVLALAVATAVGLAVLGYQPAALRVVLVVLTVGAVLVALTATYVEAPAWETSYRRATLASGRDARTSAYLRLIEGNRTARAGDPALRDRLRDLSEQALQVRHGLAPGDPRARERLTRDAPRLLAVLDGPPRRLPAATLDHCLSEIEDL